jgi:hypothetical protein
VTLPLAGADRAPPDEEEQAARGEALEVLRADYMARVREVAERVRPSLAQCHAGTLYDCEATRVLERECKAELCGTEQDARLVFALSPHWEADEISAYGDVRNGAKVFAALDVAAVLGADWYIRAHGLSPAEVRP